MVDTSRNKDSTVKKEVSLRSKRKIDHYIGIFLANLFELVAFAAGQIFRRNHKDVPFDRVLVMKFSGMGSLAVSYPSILELKKTRPEVRIVFWGTKQTTTLARELGVFSEIVELEDSSFTSAFFSLIKNLIRILRFRPQWAFDLEVYSKLSSVLCLWTLALNRVGFISDTTRFRKYLHTHLMYFNRFRYVGDLYDGMFSMVLPPVREVRRRHDLSGELGIFIEDAGQTRGQVVININTGELFPLRRWPLEKFRQLVEKMLDEYGHDILLTGSPGERDFVEEFRLGLNHCGARRVRNLAGVLSLREMMGLLKGCRLFITNDSGPMHLAVLMDAPVVALFGPTHPAHFLPAGKLNAVACYHDYICSPCVHVIDSEYLPCRQTAPCMSSIEVPEVYAAVKRLLEASGSGGSKRAGTVVSIKAYERE